MPEILFGRYPEKLGGDGQECIAMERSAAERTVRAYRCRNWGEFAALAGTPWSDLAEEWADDFTSYHPRSGPLRPESKFRYTNIVFGLESGPELPHPARVAYELLVRRHEYARSYILARELEFEYGNPGGALECLKSPSRDAFYHLSDFLRREAPGTWQVNLNDSVVRRAMGMPR